MLHTYTTEVFNEKGIFTNYGSFFWVRHGILFIADAHLGKLSHFRKEGIAISNIGEEKNIEKLTLLINKFTPKKLIFLGDLFHSVYNTSWELFKQFRLSFNTIEFVLVKGNHDILIDNYYNEINIKVVDDLIIDNLHFSHEAIDTDLINVYGHIHPGVRLKGKGKNYESVSCFLITQNQMIMASFGIFTGKYYVKPTINDRVILTHPEFILEKEIS